MLLALILFSLSELAVAYWLYRQAQKPLALAMLGGAFLLPLAVFLAVQPG